MVTLRDILVKWTEQFQKPWQCWEWCYTMNHTFRIIIVHYRNPIHEPLLWGFYSRVKEHSTDCCKIFQALGERIADSGSKKWQWIHLFGIVNFTNGSSSELQSDDSRPDSGINRDRAALGASNWKEQAAFQGRTYGMVISHNHPILWKNAFGTRGLDPYPGFNASE